MPGPAFVKKYAVVNTLTAAQLASLVSGSTIVRGDIYVISDTNDVMVGLTSTTYQIMPVAGGGGGGVAWGAITGSLASQADLVAALAGKQPLDGDLTSLAAAATTGDMYYRSAANTWSPVTVGSNLTFSGGVLSGSSGVAFSGNVSVDFGSTFKDKAQTVITGQPWISATSKIATQVRTPSGVDPDEMYLLDFKTAISNLVVGVGFTLSLYTQTKAKGVYSVSCIGV